MPLAAAEVATIGAMDYGICLPNFPAGASNEGIEAAADAAERLGWSTVWTTDHVLVDHSAVADYGRIYEAILTLAWVGARHPGLRLGTSVIVVPQRNAVLLAKELATLDALSGGRVIAGVGGGWSEPEFANLGMADRFRVRGAYLDETIRLWRHLWSGSTEPFHGRFHPLEDFEFEPLPPQGAGLPILVGGRAEPALRRAGALGDGYHSSSASPAQYAERVPVVRAAAEAAGRPAPRLSARVRVAVRRADRRGLRDARDARGDGGRGPGVRRARGDASGARRSETTDPAEVAARADRFAAGGGAARRVTAPAIAARPTATAAAAPRPTARTSRAGRPVRASARRGIVGVGSVEAAAPIPPRAAAPFPAPRQPRPVVMPGAAVSAWACSLTAWTTATSNRRARRPRSSAAALRLGLTSFGGPIAHIGHFRREYVVRRGWLDETRLRGPRRAVPVAAGTRRAASSGWPSGPAGPAWPAAQRRGSASRSRPPSS